MGIVGPGMWWPGIGVKLFQRTDHFMGICWPGAPEKAGIDDFSTCGFRFHGEPSRLVGSVGPLGSLALSLQPTPAGHTYKFPLEKRWLQPFHL